MNSVLRDIPMYHGLQHACLIGDKEISVINENYKRSKADDVNDDDMEPEGQGTGEGTSAKLRGKASEVRHLAKPLSALWAHFMNKNVETHRQIDLYLRLNIQFENILDDHKDDYALPLAAYTAFMNAAFL